MQIKQVEFEPPINGGHAKPFSGYVCLARTECGYWISGCDLDSPHDAYEDARERVSDGVPDYIILSTVVMFHVEAA